MERRTRLAIAVGLCGLVVVSAWLRYRFLASSPYPMGIDGYFYPIQLRSLLEHGHLQYPASPLAFWLMTPLAAVTDPITGAKLGAAIGGALIALPAYAVGARLGGNRAAGVGAAVIATTSAGSWYLSVEFVKNGWGLTAALTAVWLVLRAVERPSRARIAVAVAGVVAAALTHKMALVIVGALGGAAIAGALIDRGTAAVRRALVWIAGAVVAVVAIAITLAVVWPGRFVGGRDLGLIARLWTADGHPGAPALYLDHGHFVLHMGYEALIGGIAAVLAATALVLAWRRLVPAWWNPVTRTRAHTAAAIAAIALAAMIALPWIDVGDPQGLGFRIRIAAFVPLALAAAVVIGQAAAIVRAAVAPVHHTVGAIAAGVFAIGFVAVHPGARPEGVVRVHPAMVAAAESLAGQVPPGDVVVVSERHILFMAAYYARVPIVLRPESISPARRWRLMPRAFIGRPGDSLYRLLMSARATPGVAAPRGLHPRDPNGLVLVPEATWTWIVDRLPPGPRTYYRAWQTI